MSDCNHWPTASDSLDVNLESVSRDIMTAQSASAIASKRQNIPAQSPGTFMSITSASKSTSFFMMSLGTEVPQ